MVGNILSWYLAPDFWVSEDQPRRKKKTLTNFIQDWFQFEAQPSIKHYNLIFKDSIGIPLGLHLKGHITRRKPGLTVLQGVRSSSALSAWTWLRHHGCQSKRLKDLQQKNKYFYLCQVVHQTLGKNAKHMNKLNLHHPNCNVAVSIPLFSPFSLPGLALGSSGTFAEAKEKATSAWISYGTISPIGTP